MIPDHHIVNSELPGGGWLKHTIFKSTIMFLALTTFSVFLRLWAKLRTGKRVLGVDDYSMVTAWFFYILLCVLALSIALLERHNTVLTLQVADKFLLRLTLGEVMFMLSTIFLKVSLMLFYRQFVWKGWQRRAIIIAGACSITLSLIALFLSLFQCGTLSHMAYRQVKGQCVRRDRFVPLLYLHGATGAVTDWAFALLPISVLIKSSLKPHIKLSVCILLILGVTGSVAACFRTAYVYGVWFDKIFLDPSFRPTFYDHSAPEIVLALTELGFGISAASLACLQPLLRHFVHKVRNWIHRRFTNPFGDGTRAVRSYVGLLPHVQSRNRGWAAAASKQVAQVREYEPDQSPRQQYPPHPAIRRGGMAERGRANRRASSLRAPSTLESIVEVCEQDHRKYNQSPKDNLTIGVLPTISTGVGEEDEDDCMISPLQKASRLDDEERMCRFDSRADESHQTGSF